MSAVTAEVAGSVGCEDSKKILIQYIYIYIYRTIAAARLVDALLGIVRNAANIPPIVAVSGRDLRLLNAMSDYYFFRSPDVYEHIDIVFL